MIRYIVGLAVALALCGCATQRIVALPDTFDEVQAAAMLAPGKNTIKGSAVMRQRGGGVVTCAGLAVRLIPATQYAKQRMAQIYGSTNFARQSVRFEPESPGYNAAIRSSVCNAQGFFSFESLSDGEFFITTVVAWQVGYAVEGGALMARVAVAGGETKEITLAR